MTETVTKEKLVSDVKEVLHDAEVLFKSGAENLGEQAKEARNRLNERLAELRERIREAEVVVRQKTIEGLKTTDKTIRAHPYESIAIAFGLGLLLGVVIARR